MDADRRRRLERAGLAKSTGNGVEELPRALTGALGTTPHNDERTVPLPPTGVPRRSVAFGLPDSADSPSESPEWNTPYTGSHPVRGDPPYVESASRARGDWAHPRRSMGPTAFTAQPSAIRTPLSRAGRVDPDAQDNAYAGPGTGPRDMLSSQRLVDMIDELVGEEPDTPPPAYLKVAKLQPPKAYEGKDDLDGFEVWLRSLLEYFNTLRITGPSTDRDRLRILGTCLGGDAAVWFYNTVQSPSRERRDWTFQEAVIGLFRRFIHRDNYLLAAQQFERLRYNASKGGVAALYEQLLYAADRMWERPTKYQMKIRFMDALPEGFEHVLTVVNGLSVEYNSLAQLYSAALDMEQNTRAMNMRRKAHEHAQHQHSGAHHKGIGETRHANGLAKPVTQLPRPGSTSRARPNGLPQYQSRPSTVPKPPPRPAVRTTPGYVPKRSGDHRPGDNPASKSTAKCFSCGRIGHFASDPTCPNAGKKPAGGQRMFAQRVVNDMSDGEREQDQNDTGENTYTPADTLENQEEKAAGEDVPTRTDIVQFSGMEITGNYPESEYELEGSQYDSDNEKYYDSNDDDAGHASVFMGGMRIEPLTADSPPA
ncbi:hypothetical protein FKP32DRAFT_1583814, partial [Trametes sanguinea]